MFGGDRSFSLLRQADVVVGERKDPPHVGTGEVAL